MKHYALSLLLAIVVGNLSLGNPVERSPEEIPFDLHRDYMVLVQGRINSVEDVTFLIDTGSTSTIISPFLAKKLQLKGVEKKAVAVATRLRAKEVILHNIGIGSTRFRVVPALVTDLSALTKVSKNIDAVLGMDALVRTSLRIDYRSCTLTFRPERSLSSSSVMALHNLQPSLTLQAGGKPVRLLVDTGAQDLVLFGSRLDNPPQMHRSSWQSKPLVNLGGSNEGRLVFLTQVQLGSARWEQLNAYLIEGRIEHCRDLEGFVGPASLGWSSVQFDFAQNRLSWEQ